MTPNQLAALQAVRQAQQAFRHGDKSAARHLAEQALRLAPELEEPWLMMASLANPRACVGYLEQALKINPNSERARKGMHWAAKRLRAEPTNGGRRRSDSSASRGTSGGQEKSSSPKTSVLVSRRVSLPIFFVSLACLALIWVAAFGGTSPALASILGNIASDSSNHPVWNLHVHADGYSNVHPHADRHADADGYTHPHPHRHPPAYRYAVADGHALAYRYALPDVDGRTVEQLQ
jgi:hypothetical protein